MNVEPDRDKGNGNVARPADDTPPPIPAADRAQIRRWRTAASPESFARAAADFILDRAARAIAARGAFRMVLAGGNTPRLVYRTLRDAPAHWPAWHLHFGDERCLPAADPARNSRMAGEAWLDHVPIPRDQVHEILAGADPDRAAADYGRRLAGVGTFDLALLGLGADGHVASLFPGGDWLRHRTWPEALPVHDAPKPPPARVSLSPARLSDARAVLFLIAGADKRAAVAAWRAGADLPAARIRPPAGVDILLLE